MRQIRNVTLTVCMAILFIGVIYIGVIGVLWQDPKAPLMFHEEALWGNEWEACYEKVEDIVSKTDTFVRKEQQYEKRISRYIDAYMADMTLEQKLAQMMILTNEHDIHEQNLRRYQPGGIILFEPDFRKKTVEKVRGRIDQLQSYMTVPLFVGVDEEGGQVSRLKVLQEESLPVFAGARELSQLGMDAIEEDTTQKMQWFEKIGLNMNFAPVADVVGNKNSYMYMRSASEDAQEVSAYIETVLTVMKQYQIMGCIKHFPGYGDNVNTHQGMAKDNRSIKDYEEKDFVPFHAGIRAGVDMVMVSHIIMSAVDKDHPASLSEDVHSLLREDLNFNGVIIADDLNMQAILKTMTIGEATAKAYIAGNDMIFSADFAASMKGATKAFENGELTEKQVDESVKRILRMKIRNGLIDID